MKDEHWDEHKHPHNPTWDVGDHRDTARTRHRHWCPDCPAEMVPVGGGQWKCHRCEWDEGEPVTAAEWEYPGRDCEACEYLDIDDGQPRCRTGACMHRYDDYE